MARKIIYFINPVSGTSGKEKLLEMIHEKTGQQNIPYEILSSEISGKYFFLKDKIENDQVTDIVICGGDGTVNQIAGTLLEADVNIGIIPMGSGNGLALTARIPVQAEKAIDLVFRGKASYIDSFFINDSFSCMLSGLGFDAQVAYDFSLQPKRGLSTYIKQSIRNFFRAAPYTFEIINKGFSFTTEAYFISIANSNQFGNQITIAPRASLTDGLLDIVIVKKMSKLKLIRTVVKHIRSGQVMQYEETILEEKDIVYFQTDKLIVHNRSGAPLHIDGDPADASKKFIVQVVPGAFRLIQPVD